MKAIRIHSFGDADVLHFEETMRPEAGRGQILVRVKAAGVNPVDYKMRSGEYRKTEIELPAILGRDVAGIVEAIGPDVTGLAPGDEVYAFLGAHSGGYAEFALANAQEVARKPATLDFAHAAAVPLAATTAWQGLFDHGKLRRGERVLIHGAAGGVGHFAVQFARVAGAAVIATGRAEDERFLRDLGATEVVDYRAERFEHAIAPVDLVFDLVAGETQRRSWAVLKDGGRLISTLGRPEGADGREARNHHARGEGFMARPDATQLREFARLIDAGEVRVLLHRRVPLADARHAHEALEQEHIAGKVVLDVEPALAAS